MHDHDTMMVCANGNKNTGQKHLRRPHHHHHHQKCVQSCLVVFVFLGLMGSNAAALDESIVVRKFSLVTEIGENILHKDFNRRRLADGKFRRLSLKFRAADLDVSICCAILVGVSLWFVLMFLFSV